MATLLKDYHLSLTHIVFLGVRKDCQKSISLYLSHAAHFTIRFRTIGGNNFYRFYALLTKLREDLLSWGGDYRRFMPCAVASGQKGQQLYFLKNTENCLIIASAETRGVTPLHRRVG